LSSVQGRSESGCAEKLTVLCSVVDRHRFDADPDPNLRVDADPDPDWHQNVADAHADPTRSHADPAEVLKFKHVENFIHNNTSLQ
jgi:hypothetical protein